MLIDRQGISYIVSEPLESTGALVHAFSTRKGGVSGPPFSGLNLSLSVGDDPEMVDKNLGLLKLALGIPDGARLLGLKQVHGSRILTIKDKKDIPKEAPKADGAVTDLGGLIISVLTADCLPLLLYDPVKGVAGAVHAGWRGTLRGICKSAVQSMAVGFGTNPEDIVAVLGPCIGPCCYTVGDELIKEFESAFGHDPSFIKRDRGRPRLDLAAINIKVLKEAGLREENIKTEPYCTSCNEELFFSHRRDKRTGRQMSLIMIRG